MCKRVIAGLGLGRREWIHRVPSVFGRQGAHYLGHLGPIPFYIHPSAIGLVLLVFFFNASSDVSAILVTLTVLVASIMLHEMGHALAARSLGAQGVSITLGGLGGLCESSRDARPSSELIILIAGPAVSFALWFGCGSVLDWLLLHRPDLLINNLDITRGGRVTAGHSTLLYDFLSTGAGMNLVLGIFNSLPIFPLDGGQIVFNLMRLFPRSYTLARKATLLISFATGIGLVIFLATFSQLQNHTWTLFLVGLMLYNAWNYLR